MALAYLGNKLGLDVIDYRGGESQDYFSYASTLRDIRELEGIKVIRAEGASSITVGNRLLKQCETGKYYYFVAGRHAAIVRKAIVDEVDKDTYEVIEKEKLQYLELQSSKENGWKDFDKNPRTTLNYRFGCTTTSCSSSYWDFMIDIEASDFPVEDLRSILGYINTKEGEQKKGAGGTIK